MALIRKITIGSSASTTGRRRPIGSLNGEVNSFVWCGAGLPNYQQPHMPHFPPAFRAPTRYNQVGMFVPTEESWHIVDRVSDAADPSHHRFSFTSWLEEGPPPGSVEL